VIKIGEIKGMLIGILLFSLVLISLGTFTTNFFILNDVSTESSPFTPIINETRGIVIDMESSLKKNISVGDVGTSPSEATLATFLNSGLNSLKILWALPNIMEGFIANIGNAVGIPMDIDIIIITGIFVTIITIIVVFAIMKASLKVDL
jgi:hypothetical protein